MQHTGRQKSSCIGYGKLSKHLAHESHGVGDGSGTGAGTGRGPGGGNGDGPRGGSGGTGMGNGGFIGTGGRTGMGGSLLFNVLINAKTRGSAPKISRQAICSAIVGFCMHFHIATLMLSTPISIPVGSMFEPTK